MCFTQGMSVTLAVASFASAWYEWRSFRSWQYSAGIAYWGLEEVIQAVQHSYAASADDDYAMCKNRTNQMLTDMGAAHLVFQPVFVSFTLLSMYRKHDIEARILSDFIFKLCVLAGFWFVSYSWICAAMGVDQSLLPPATEDCPNYQYLYEGYDGFLNKTTPNQPGSACVYYAPTETGHLAWAIPIYKQSYYFPSPSVHFFLFFGPYIIMFKKPMLQVYVFLAWLTGPILTKYLTASVNEQPAIWCFNSVAQISMYAIAVRYFGIHKKPILAEFRHPGTYGEQPMTYVLRKDDGDTLPLLDLSKSDESPKRC
ncbi:Synaptic ras GTPase activating protein [Seminavis robusta]|uniref:Synaptic ras GTPase activating protein n=1 Tax=Seminavis robusta TaxID=568900 RepID=A0A9N8E2T0_9STRA|nr:Synaptic ras GTPase activating protein [Seminavis robusta]|eukprot:Sro447_g144810.1 Synaptic ras GTPase activating protein (312) ;mRNA; r:8016-8951